LKLIAPLFQIGDQLFGLRFGAGLHLARFGFERSQCGIHLVDSLLGPIQGKMRAALLWQSSPPPFETNARIIPALILIWIKKPTAFSKES
jgi:hypothetical protein